MTEPEYPAEPETVDIALRDALAEATHPEVRYHIRQAQQWRVGILSGNIDADGFVYPRGAGGAQRPLGVIVEDAALGADAWISCAPDDVVGEP